jgi:hypothetical protein
MAKQYGPWAIPIDAGGNPQLSTFWRRRLTMLVPTSQASTTLSRRNVLGLVAAATALLVLPTFQSVRAGEDNEKPIARIKIEIDVNSPASEKSGKGVTVVRVEQKNAREEQKPATKESKEAHKEAKKGGLGAWKLANGTTMWEGSSSCGTPIDHKELSKLIAEKKYTFLRTFDGDGEKQWVYSLKLPIGSNMSMNFSMPLDNVTSWEDYEKKRTEQRQQRHEKINEAIAAGRFRLVNVEVLQFHLCRDVQSNTEFKVKRDTGPDGKPMAMPLPTNSPLPPSVKTTGWQDYLKAVRSGKVQLLGLEVINSYTYEMTANDGTKLIFNYGGKEPLKMPAKVADKESEESEEE